MTRIFCAVGMAFVWAACSPADTPAPDVDSYDVSDQDQDCLSDLAEGRIEGTDTDRDGTPDYLDDDSDNDTIPDALEAHFPTCEIAAAPADNDLDGTPDFRDVDSDGNGILDKDEFQDDTDGDGIPNSSDPDDDQDHMSDVEEIGPDVADPADSDRDRVPDYQDIDSDNDTILDAHEHNEDSDLDGLPDYVDPDSDNDGIPDIEEAGDGDLQTFPVDTDDDFEPDYLDIDSDNDGLTDAWEFEHRSEYGTDFRSQDTDEDTVMDWIEVAAGTNPTNGNDSPLTRGHFVFIMPYESTPEPEDSTLVFSSSVQQGDVFFALDLTASMDRELDSIRDEMTQIVEGVTCGPHEDPDETNCIPDLWVGFGWYTESSTGSSGGLRTLQVEQNLTANYAEMISAIPGNTAGGSAECQRRAAYCTVYGPEGRYCPAESTRNMDEYPCPGAGIGFPCFRPDAARMLALVTDEEMNEDPTPDFDTVADALNSAQITFIGINADNHEDAQVTGDLMEIAVRTESYDEYGAPLVFLGADDAVDEAVADAIRAAAKVPLDVTVRAHGNIDDQVDPLEFINHMEINTDAEECTPWPDIRDANHDGYDDTFLLIEPGLPVCWQVYVNQNDIAPPIATPQVFTATIEVRGGPGATMLDSRDVYFLVPPRTYIPPPG